MNRKRTLRQFLSGMMAILTVFTTIFSSLPAYASEEEKKAKEYPLYEEVKEFLDVDEVVTAKDLEVDTGSVFDITKDMTGIEIPDKEKVKVTFHEAKNEADEDFSINHADTYKAVYYVEPVSGHPVYQISRKIIVREAAASGTVQQEMPVTDAGTETSMEESGDEEGEPDSQEPVTELPIPETETEPVTDGTEITEEETTGDPELPSNETEMPQEP
ncbi:MAG: Cna protein B-type domain protein, partial [Lachnospiraceae bacterium]